MFTKILSVYKTLIGYKGRKTDPVAKLVRSKYLLEDVEHPERQQEIIKDTHKFGEHRGILENLKKIKTKYYFPHAKEKITEFIRQCDTCNLIKYNRHPQQIKFQLTETPDRPLQIVHTDVFSLNSNKFLTLIDKFTKHGTAYFLENQFAKTLKEKYKQYIGTHGIPVKIVSDQEIYAPYEIQNLFKKYNIEHHVTTPYNSTGNSPVERFHSTLKELCSIIQLQNPSNTIPETVQTAIIAYNNSIHSTTGMTPFQLFNGHYHPDTPHYGTELEYVHQHRETFTKLYDQIAQTSANNKEKIITKLNKLRKPPDKISTGIPIFVKKPKRSKVNPEYKKETVIQTTDNSPIIITNKGKVHLSKIKKPFQAHSRPEDGNQASTTQQRSNTNTQGDSTPI